MSRNLNQMRSNEDVEAVLMNKLAEKRKILEEARAMYSDLCARVENANIELTGIKMERFKMEGLLQESDIRVRVYEKMERELRDEADRATTSIKEAEIRQKTEHAARDAYNKGFVKKVMEMAEDYCRFKGNCDRKNVSDSLQDLRVADAQLACEIEEISAEMGIEEGDNYVSLVSADPEDERTLDALKDLQSHLEYDIRCAELTNAKHQAETEQLEARKKALLREIEALKEIMEK